MKKQGLMILALTVVVALFAGHEASAVLPSGNGQTVKSQSVSVAIASDQTVPVSGTITVDTSALATAAKQDTGNTSLATIATNTTGAATAANQSTGNTTLSTISSTLSTISTNTGNTTQATASAAVTASDSTALTCTKGLWVGTAGNLSLKLSADSSAVTWKNVPSGTYVPGSVIRVMAATTAADVVCLQ
jgi:hypothetical protein